jgi:hypothetical protein
MFNGAVGIAPTRLAGFAERLTSTPSFSFLYVMVNTKCGFRVPWSMCLPTTFSVVPSLAF